MERCYLREAQQAVSTRQGLVLPEEENLQWGTWRVETERQTRRDEDQAVNRQTKSSGPSRRSSSIGKPIVCQKNGSYHLVQMSRQSKHSLIWTDGSRCSAVLIAIFLNQYMGYKNRSIQCEKVTTFHLQLKIRQHRGDSSKQHKGKNFLKKYK